MLHAMFSGRFDTKPNEDGSYFIDRDGTHFRYILNYLRTGQLLLPEDNIVRRAVNRGRVLSSWRYHQWAESKALQGFCDPVLRSATDLNQMVEGDAHECQLWLCLDIPRLPQRLGCCQLSLLLRQQGTDCDSGQEWKLHIWRLYWPIMGKSRWDHLSMMSYIIGCAIWVRHADQCFKSVSPVDIQKSHWTYKVHRIDYAYSCSTVMLHYG